jgi:hypothetical protein
MPKNERLTIGQALTKIEAVRAYCDEILEAADKWPEDTSFEAFTQAYAPGANILIELVELESRIPY